MKVYFDGGCKPNPGMMEVAVVFSDGRAHHTRLEHGTNNKAEWLALIWALGLAKEQGLDEVHLLGDSKLVVNQANGDWQVKDQSIKVFYDDFVERRREFKKVTIGYVPREKNLAGHHIEEVNPSKPVDTSQRRYRSQKRNRFG